MNRYIFALFLYLLVGSYCSLIAQDTIDECGVTLEEADLTAAYKHFEAAKEASLNRQDYDCQTIPLRLVFFRRTWDEEWSLPYEEVIQESSQVLAEMGIELVLTEAPITVIDNDLGYLSSRNSSDIAEMNEYVEPGVLTVFVPTKVSGGFFLEICGYGNFPWSEERNIVISSSCFDSATLLHEFGHYFGLFHTHQYSFGLEKVDGTNCNKTGDLLCDTPADPDLRSDVNDSCIYTGTSTDYDGAQYEPDLTLYMSYSLRDCRSTFSPQQVSIMKYFIARECENSWTFVDEPYVRIFPNPASDYLFIMADFDTELYLMDIRGNRYFVPDYKYSFFNLDKRMVTIPSNLRPGVYFLHIFSNEVSYKEVIRLVIQ